MFSILDFGAQADGKTSCRTALQAAVDAAGEAGGGTVLVPSGNYCLDGTVRLRSHVYISLEAGATLLGTCGTLFAAHGCTDLGFSGYGKMEARGTEEGAAAAFSLSACTDLSFAELSVSGAASCLSLSDCERIRIHALSLNTAENGLMLDACRDAVIADCLMQCGGISLSLSAYSGSTAHVAVSSCVISASTTAIAIGGEGNGELYGITVGGCVISGARSSGISIRSLGTRIRGVLVSNMVMDAAQAPLDVKLDAAPDGQIGALSDLSLQGIYAAPPEGKATTEGGPALIAGSVLRPIEHLIVRDVTIVSRGGKEATEPVPAHGLILQHVRGVLLSDLSLRTLLADARPDRLLLDVDGLCED